MNIISNKNAKIKIKIITQNKLKTIDLKMFP